MFQLPTNNIEWAQFITSLAVSGYTDRAIRTQLANHTDIDPNGVPAKTGGFVTGLLVAHKLRPYTDDAVLKVVDLYSGWKSNRKNSKTAK